MVGLGEFLQFGDPKLFINERGVIRSDFVEVIDADEHLLRGSEVAIGGADERQCAFKEKLFEERFQRFGVVLANVPISDDKSKVVGGAGQSDEIGRIIRKALKRLASEFN